MSLYLFWLLLYQPFLIVIIVVVVALAVISLGLSSPSDKKLLKKWGSLLVPHVFLWNCFSNGIRSSWRSSWIVTRSVNFKFVENTEKREEIKGKKDGRKKEKEGRSRSFFLLACLVDRCRLGIIGGSWRDAQSYYCCCFCYLQNQQQQRTESRRGRWRKRRSVCMCVWEINTKYAE